MKWGETQNLLSVIIGLNVAYYAFKEMRTPHLATLQRRIGELHDRIDQRMEDVRLAKKKIPNWTKIHRALMDIYFPVQNLKGDINVMVELTSTRKFENVLGVPAMIVAALATVLLVISTVEFEEQLSLWLFYPIIFLGFAPPLAFILTNLAIVWVADRKYGTEFKKHWNTYHLEIDGELIDYNLDISRARFERDHPEQPLTTTPATAPQPS